MVVIVLTGIRQQREGQSLRKYASNLYLFSKATVSQVQGKERIWNRREKAREKKKEEKGRKEKRQKKVRFSSFPYIWLVIIYINITKVVR